CNSEAQPEQERWRETRATDTRRTNFRLCTTRWTNAALSTSPRKLHVHIRRAHAVQAGRAHFKSLRVPKWLCVQSTGLHAPARSRAGASPRSQIKNFSVGKPVALHPFTKQRLSKARGHASHRDARSA